MCSVLGENYPDLLDELLAAGARKMTFADMVPKHLTDQYQPEPGDEKLWMLLCRRATIETILRRYVEREPNLRIRSQTFVTDVLVAQTQTDSGENTLTVTGLELTDRQNKNLKEHPQRRHHRECIWPRGQVLPLVTGQGCGDHRTTR
jgi:2-polyprenyl-6-methoxyphenol hydroxylase-like FAD-dependent oxidoreductase